MSGVRIGLGPLLAGALALGLCAALLVPSPAPDRMAARALARLLEAEAEREEPRSALFAALAGHERVALALQPAAPGAGDPDSRRAVAAALAIASARARDAQRTGPGALVPEGAPADVRLEIRLRRSPDGWYARAGVAPGALLATDPERHDTVFDLGPWRAPGREALVPPLVAIVVALLWRRVLLALLLGVWSGASLLAAERGAGFLWSPLLGAWDVLAVYFRRELFDSFRIELIGFVVALLALVGVASRGGGMHGLVEAIARRARGPRSAQGVTFAAGLALFFDDYANCLIVGSSLRSLTDRMRVSRAKLAYIVDSTAAPVAGLSLLSTWIAFEVSTFAPQLPSAGITESPYAIFVATLPWRFYCVFALLTVGLVILFGRDLQPMRRAELSARAGAGPGTGGSDAWAELAPAPQVPPRARNVLLPIAAVIGVSLLEIFRGGGGPALLLRDPAALGALAGWSEVLFAGSGAAPLLAGSLAGLWCAAWLVGSPAWRLASALALLGALAGAWLPLPPGGAVGALFGFALAAGPAWALARGVARRSAPDRLSPGEIASAAGSSTSALGTAVAILFLAWMIGSVCRDAATADYLVALLAPALAPAVLPVALFGVAALVAFATGTSWGAMSILLPNVVALAAALGGEHALGDRGMVIACIGAVLEGAILGDHCSPISDTTVLSSLASGCDHVEHVRTQAPYALLAAGVAIAAGYLPSLWWPDWPWPLAFLVGAGLITAALFAFGAPVDRVRNEGDAHP